MPRRRYDDDEEERLWSSKFEEDDEFPDEEEEDYSEQEDDDEPIKDDDEEETGEGSTGFGDLPSMLEEGLGLAESGDLDEAIDILADAVERFPESPLSHYNLGVAHFMKMKEDLERSEMWENLGDEEGHYEEAVSCFEHALEIDEHFVGALNNLATLYALRERAQDAVELWERSLEVEPDQPEVRSDLEEFRFQLESGEAEEDKE